MKTLSRSVGITLSRSHLVTEKGEEIVLSGNEWIERLSIAFTAFASENPGVRRVAVALMPDVAVVRTVELPPMRLRDARRVIESAPGRYMPPTTGRPMMTLVAQGGPALRHSVFLMAVADEVDIEAIHGAARVAGLEVVTVRPAVTIWWDAVRRRQRRLRLPASGIFQHGAGTVVLNATAGEPMLRHVWLGAPAASIAARAAVTDTNVLVASASLRSNVTSLEDLTTALAHDRVEVSTASSGTIAAAGVRKGSVSEFVTQAQRDQANRSVRLASVGVLVLALVVSIVSGTIEHQRLGRELEFVTGKRKALAASVRAATSAERDYQLEASLIRTIDSLSSANIDWMQMVDDVSAVLPEDARLTRVSVDGDSLTVLGEGSSSQVMAKLLSARPWVRGVKVQGGTESSSSSRFGVTVHVSRVVELSPVTTAVPSAGGEG